MPYAENHVGWKATDTSESAANHVKDRVGQLRERVLGVIRFNSFGKGKGCTADEVADTLDETVLSIRPRVSELKNMGQIIDTGIRRKNSSGRSAAVMAYAKPQMVMDL